MISEACLFLQIRVHWFDSGTCLQYPYHPDKAEESRLLPTKTLSNKDHIEGKEMGECATSSKREGKEAATSYAG